MANVHTMREADVENSMKKLGFRIERKYTGTVSLEIILRNLIMAHR